MLPHPRRFDLPRVDAPPSRSGLPLLGALAPLVMAVVLWAVTQSIFSLLIGLLSPVLAFAGLLDRRLSARRQRRDEAARVRKELAALERRLSDHLDAERDRLARAARGPARVGAGATLRGDALEMPIALGSAQLPSALEWPTDDLGRLPAVLAAEAREVMRRSDRVRGPVVVDARGGLAVTIEGDADAGATGAAVRRALALRCALALPDDWDLLAPEGEDWCRGLARRVTTASPPEQGEPVSGGEWVLTGPAGEIRIGVPERASSAAMRLTIGVDDAMLAGDGVTHRLAAFRPQRVSRAQAALAIAARDRDTSPGATAGELPASVDYDELAGVVGRAGGLAAPLGLAVDGRPVLVDLVDDGPHAIVGGTTGSGKSELLVTWVLGMAARTPPSQLSLLLVDFKGGAAFAPLEQLPHVVGVLSDLDSQAARRAVVSLRTELLRRERMLAERRARSIEELDPGLMPRLVVVVDEFAALIAEQPELGAVVTDLAARGRSLGIHLVLCTQRPAGIVKDAVLANATLRVSLRVNNRHDSSSVIGSDAAAELPSLPRGRGVLAVEGRPVPMQVARATESDIAAVSENWRGAPTAAAFWTPGLPKLVTRADLVSLPAPPAPGLVFGLVDLPEQQRIGAAVYDPAVDGHLLVIGGRGAGTTTTLAAIAEAAGAAALVGSSCLPDAWALIQRVADLPSAPSKHAAGPLLLVDDVDRLLDEAGDEARVDLAALLVRAARSLEVGGGALVLGASRPLGGVSTLNSAIDRRLLLALPSREDHVMAGGDGRDWSVRRRPGSGIWGGAEIQVATAPAPPAHEIEVARVALDPTQTLAIATGRVGVVREGLRHAGTTTLTLDDVDRQGGALPLGIPVIGDIDDWLADFGALDRARRSGRLLVHAASPADVRALTRIRRPLPPLDPRRDEAWCIDGREVTRVTTPW
nr:FtsK/SpoIIIE domain-containing protein [Schumannella luteola]